MNFAIWNNYKSQNGFALLNALVVIAILSSLLINFLYKHDLAFQKSARYFETSKIIALSDGLKEIVSATLLLDNDTSDYLDEIWAQELPMVPFAGGQIGGFLQDLDSKFNLNLLNHSNKQYRNLYTKFFNRLLKLHQLENNKNILPVIQDWLDSDDKVRSNGAEKASYLNKRYTTANNYFSFEDELYLLHNITPEEVGELKKFITVLPIVPFSNFKFNVNTMDKTMLRAIGDWFSDEMADRWIKHRKKSPAKNISIFRSWLRNTYQISPNTLSAEVSSTIYSVKSQYFKLSGQILLGDTSYSIFGIFFRRHPQNVAKQNLFLLRRWFDINPQIEEQDPLLDKIEI